MTRRWGTISELDRMLLRELGQSKGVLVAIALITAIGIMSFVAMLTAYNNLEQSRQRYYTRCRMADFWVDLKKAPLSDVENLRDIPGIADLRSRIQFQSLVDLPDVDKPLGGMLLSMPDTQRPIINNFILRQGTYFTPQRDDEVIINESFAQERHLRPGDRLRLIVDGRQLDLLIVGVAISSEFVYLIPPGGLIPAKGDYGVFWIKRGYAEDVLDFDGACNQVVGVLDPSVAEHPEVVLDEIDRRLDAFGVFATTERARQISHMSLRGEMDGLQTMSYFMPILFLGVAAIVLNTLIASAVQRQRTIIGTLKALGYDNGVIFAHFIKFALIVALGGSLLGCGVGYWLAGLFTEMYRAQFFKFPDLINNVYPTIWLSGILLALVCALAGAIRGARRAVRLDPAEAMRPPPPKAGHRIALERWPALWSRLGASWQTVLRNLMRERGRAISGILAAVVGAALMVTTLFMSDAMDFLVTFQFERLLVNDYVLAFREDLDERALDEARRLPGVTYAEGTFSVACTLENGLHARKAGVEGIPPNAVLTVPSTPDGRRVEMPDSGIVLTERLARLLDARAGEQITLTPVRGRKEPRQVTVAAVIDSYLGMAAYADHAWLNRLVGETSSYSSVQLRAVSNHEQQRAMYRAVKELPNVQAISSARETKESLESEMLGMMRATTFILIGFSGLIYFGSILNASLISLSERQREIATYRVLGYSPGEVGGIFLRESLTVNMVGATLGLLAGYWMSVNYAGMFDYDTIRFPFVLHPSSYAIAWLLAAVFTLLAHMVVQRAIHRMNWLEALNIRE